MVKQRILDGGADAAIWLTQFGFRTKSSTEEAIYIARRTIETALAQRGGSSKLLALDWAKAFDSVRVDCLLDALRRFGIPAGMRRMIEHFLRRRRFHVKDSHLYSDTRPQNCGISQGCTLSPLLFVIVMTVLLEDASSSLSTTAQRARERGELAEVVYADDTLLIGIGRAHLEEYLAAISREGAKYGMQLHSDKFQLLSVNQACQIQCPDGTEVGESQEMEYLGTVLSSQGGIGRELSRRIGARSQRASKRKQYEQHNQQCMR